MQSKWMANADALHCKWQMWSDSDDAVNAVFCRTVTTPLAPDCHTSPGL